MTHGPKAMRRARIVEIGMPADDDVNIEGGGLVIGFIPAGATAPRRVVLAFNECRMWVE
jgi:hypothetical protein